MGDNNEEALAEGYILGRKERFSDEMLVKIRRAGLSHLVAVSGFHLVALIDAPLKRLRKISRLFSLIISILSAVLFVLIVGLSASLFRASLVYCIKTIFWYFGRTAKAARVLIYALAITLVVNPFMVLDIGWQYSFVAYGAIAIVAPEIIRFFYGKDAPSGIKSSIVSSVVVQILVAPISIYNFGQVSLIGILASAVISPIVAPTIVLCLCTVIFPQLYVLTSVILRLNTALIEFFANFKLFTISLESGNAKIFLIYLPIVVFYTTILLTNQKSNRARRLAKIQKYGKIYSC